MNRRGFIGALAALPFVRIFIPSQSNVIPKAAFEGKPLGRGLPSSDKSPHPYDELETVLFKGIHRNSAVMGVWMDLNYGQTHQILEWGGQSVFPVIGNDGGLALDSVAYAMPNGWRDRYPKDYWLESRSLGLNPTRTVSDIEAGA